MKKGLKIALICLAALILAGFIWAFTFYRRISDPAKLFEESTPMAAPTAEPPASLTPAPEPDTDAAPVPDATPASPTPTPEPTLPAEEVLGAQADLSFMKKRVNVLALGIDESAERANWGSYRTDTMMLITVDFSDNSVTMISVPRDSYVKIYNEKGEIAKLEEPMAKINNAFAFGGGAKKQGFEYACMTVSRLLDVPVQHYVCVNMPVVKQLVDAMGGVDYEMDVEFTMNGRSYTPGAMHMNGQAVLDYCRLRKDSSDLVRVQRQQRMLSLILDTMKSSDQIRNIPGMYMAARSNIETDMSFEQIVSLALLASRMDMTSLDSRTVPVKGIRINDRSCVAVETEKLAEMVKNVFDKKEVQIDPEIDAEYLLNMPAGLTPQQGQILYYQSGDMYYVLFPGSSEYQGMSEAEFRALTGT